MKIKCFISVTEQKKHSYMQFTQKTTLIFLCAFILCIVCIHNILFYDRNVDDIFSLQLKQLLMTLASLWNHIMGLSPPAFAKINSRGPFNPSHDVMGHLYVVLKVLLICLGNTCMNFILVLLCTAAWSSSINAIMLQHWTSICEKNKIKSTNAGLKDSPNYCPITSGKGQCG